MLHLYDPSGSDKVDGVHAVLLHARADGQHVGVKDDVIGVKADFIQQEVIRSGADSDLLFDFSCLLGSKR